MKAYRYNSKKRSDRKFNTTGREKNPNGILFYATTLEYAENYKYVYFENGDVNYECELEIVEIENENLFDMEQNVGSLAVFHKYMENTLSRQRSDYELFFNSATTKKEKKMWQKNIDNTNNGVFYAEILESLRKHDFQFLSDFDAQTSLIDELKKIGFRGYFTKKEIAIF